MALPNFSADVANSETIAFPPTTAPRSPEEQELDDWNVFYQLLLAGKLSR
jgi:hypothetical protein